MSAVLRLGDSPEGHVCSKCNEREATTVWGDAMTINHGKGVHRVALQAMRRREPTQDPGRAPMTEPRSGPTPPFAPVALDKNGNPVVICELCGSCNLDFDGWDIDKCCDCGHWRYR